MTGFFCIIGTQRSGTTSLATLLASHPEVRMASPLFPEPKFFMKEEEFTKGKEYYLNNYFPEGASEKFVLGEKSTSYIENPEAGGRIKKFFPDAKVIILLRDPVERALSNYFYSRKNKVETRSLREVFLMNKPVPFHINEKDFSVSPFNYLGRGEYLHYLKEYRKNFPEGNMRVFILEELLSDRSTMNEVYDFLNINRLKEERSFIRSNEAERAEVVVSEVREHLRNYYRKHNEELENYLQMDLSLWRS